MTITYLVGDATLPKGDGAKIIAHVCNDIGAWGAGFVLAISKRWAAPEEMYRKYGCKMPLGDVQLVRIHEGLHVANMIAQHGVGGAHPLDLHALLICLVKTVAAASAMGASIHMPRIGCGLAGGSWDEVEPLISQVIETVDVPIYVYDLPGRN